MDNNDIFFDDPSPPSGRGQPYKYTKPADDFRPLPPSSTAVLYLAIITPHTDKYEIHGPAPSFSHLLPKIAELCSDSPPALDKLEDLQYTAADVWDERVAKPHFAEQGFTTFVVEGQRGTYTVLEVLREENGRVRDVLPAPVYTVTRHGPLVHTYTGVGMKMKLDVAKGMAATSTLVGSYVERKDAQLAARMTMELLVGEEKVSAIEDWAAGGGGGVLLAMGVGRRWEVRVQYEDEALRRARKGADAEGAGVGWRF
ncbi:uncharacterized protein M421DRAFT_104806 [Didymella exigua CBS 183.55]|uniref:Uncharacterized protein n=1 Tax=Didymella exigua CBS 183.55 TaxID=1150837 RepID=A0A6A5R6L5_9PLEO|nr:uncharacterized protein M421DRAFT_104806 [Didymella exigua CBS 183.55]KAF1922838.1 hypothetical protein M421DRAFT_104806 [Didymella exigua CBS 183.55]